MFIYVTASYGHAFGTFATHDFGETLDFESQLHEMRLLEIIYNQEASQRITPEAVHILYLIPDDVKGSSRLLDTKRYITDKADSEGRQVTDVTLYDGYKSSILENLGRKYQGKYLYEVREPEDQNEPFSSNFNQVDELVSSLNDYLVSIGIKLTRSDSIPKVQGHDKISMVPGKILVGDKVVYAIPVFGPQVRHTLNLPGFNTPEFDQQIRGIIDGRYEVFRGGFVNKEPFEDHFYTIRCNMVQNKLNQENGILFAWLKDPRKVSKITHIKNKTDCWIPVKKGKFHEIQLIIGTSSDTMARFDDDYMLAVIEIRPREWKEQST